MASNYDIYGQVISNYICDSPEGSPKLRDSYIYDNDGAVAYHNDIKAGITDQYEYDVNGRLLRTKTSAGTYDAEGNILQLDPLSRMQYTYDIYGNVTDLSYQENGSKKLSYKYWYAKDNLPTRETLPDTAVISYGYDSFRRNTKTVFTPKGKSGDDSKKLYTTYSYRKDGVSVNKKKQNVTTNVVEKYINKFGNGEGEKKVNQFQYKYDTHGNILSITDTVSKNKWEYAYDRYEQLTEETLTRGNETIKSRYTYDLGGNLVTQKVTVNGQETQNHSYVYGNAWKDQLTEYDGKQITYDVMGNPTQYLGQTMEWDIDGNLVQIGDQISYTYTSDGVRTGKTVNGVRTTYNYSNGILLSETCGDETLRYYYGTGGQIAEIGYQKGDAPEKTYFFTRNLQGDIIGIYNASNSKLVGTYSYDAWGRPLDVNGTSASETSDPDNILQKNPYRYRGYRYDQETGFYYLNSRFYDPEVKRFLSSDVYAVVFAATNGITDKNLYNYCDNNPVMRADDSGHFWHVVIGAVVGGGMELVHRFLNNYTK